MTRMAASFALVSSLIMLGACMGVVVSPTRDGANDISDWGGSDPTPGDSASPSGQDDAPPSDSDLTPGDPAAPSGDADPTPGDSDLPPGDYVPGEPPVAGNPSGTPPTLEVGRWKEITPPEVETGAPATCIAQGIALDPQNPYTIYWGSTPYTESKGGLWKSTDGGTSWRRIGVVTPAWQGATDKLDQPLHVRVNPHDSNHLYVGDGVRGSSKGFFISHDAGETFVKPQSFDDAVNAHNVGNHDIYDVAVDPGDFQHVLLTWHYPWNGDRSSGVFETTDGGETWNVFEAGGPWGWGHAIKFLYAPNVVDPTRRGNSSTWLVMTQEAGFWRTTNAGASWTKVSDVNIAHGGGTIYYTADGALYASGLAVQRSLDGGATWASVGPQGAWSILGTGTQLFTGGSFTSKAPFLVSDESEGTLWSDYNDQRFFDGPYEMAYDAANHLLYSSNWTAGVWALKVAP